MSAPEIRFDALRKNWAFKFGFGALCRLEAMFDLPFARIMQRVLPSLTVAEMADPDKLAAAALDMRVSDVREILIAGVTDPITADMAVAMMDELGLERVLQIISAAMSADAAGGPAEKKAKAPARRRRGA